MKKNNLNLTIDEMQAAIHKSVEECNDVDLGIASLVTDWSDIFINVFGLTYYKFSDCEYHFTCPSCKKDKGISLWLDSYIIPSFNCECGVQKSGNNVIELIQLLMDLPHGAVCKKIREYEAKKLKMKAGRPRKKIRSDWRAAIYKTE